MLGIKISSWHASRSIFGWSKSSRHTKRMLIIVLVQEWKSQMVYTVQKIYKFELRILGAWIELALTIFWRFKCLIGLWLQVWNFNFPILKFYHIELGQPWYSSWTLISHDCLGNKCMSSSWTTTHHIGSSWIVGQIGTRHLWVTMIWVSSTQVKTKGRRCID